MAVELNEISKLEVKKVATGEVVTLESLWKANTCVIIFFRRWGCLYCRLWAKEISDIAQTLRDHNIRLIGIGPEETGAQEFYDNKYFDGDVYTDINKEVYSKIGFKRYNYFSILFYIMSREGRSAYKKGKAANIPWNLRGDGLQNGGALIVESGGKLLHSFRQEGAAETLPSEKILEVLDLEPTKKPVSCDNNDADVESSSGDN